MPELPESGALGRRILSHDTVEAAFMRRAGYDVWSDYNLEGSYEEGPPHLLASLQRDRRWCHGNLQHLWFLFAPGLTLCSRINILIGIMAYASSPLWLLFLLLSPLLFIGGNPPGMSGLLFTYVMGLLLLPKFFAALQSASTVKSPYAVVGCGQMLMNVFAEILYSMLLAPILMLFYTRFVWSSFFGGGTKWGRQQRADDEGPSWRECIAAHWGHTVLSMPFRRRMSTCGASQLRNCTNDGNGPFKGSIPVSVPLAGTTLPSKQKAPAEAASNHILQTRLTSYFRGLVTLCTASPVS